MDEQTFIINGMHCLACTKLSAKRIKTIEGVIDALVDLDSKIARIKATRPITTKDINAVLADSDYRAEDNND